MAPPDDGSLKGGDRRVPDARSPEPRLTRLADIAPTRWRNGGGVTRELLVAPAAADWHWRVSVAEVSADGPFSSFPGVQRWFAVLDGAGVELDIDGRRHRLLPGTPALPFDGNSVTSCRLLDGPTTDLNLMLRGATGSLQPLLPHTLLQQPGGAGGLFALHDGECVHDGVAQPVPACSLLWFDVAPTSVSFHAVGRAPAAAPVAWWIAVAAEHNRACSLPGATPT